jgi:protoporphyrin/coproporphyrin ferrochelatase
MNYDAILLIAFGGPEKMADVRPFLANVLKGRPVPPQRLEEVVRHYEHFRGHSPLHEITFRQAHALRVLLEHQGLPVPVYVGMRNWHPYLYETLGRMAKDGVRHVLGFILSAQQSEASWDRYKENVAAARQQIGADAPMIEFAPSWYDHPLFIAAVADLTQQALATVVPAHESTTRVVFTAHSIPAAMPGAATYAEQVEKSACLVATALGLSQWSVAYQSRSGDPRTPWLEPDISTVLPRFAAAGVRTVVVVPIGFVCDHIEVLYDLDIEARKTAETHHLRFVRASAVNDHPNFVQMIADVVRQKERIFC